MNGMVLPLLEQHNMVFLTLWWSKQERNRLPLVDKLAVHTLLWTLVMSCGGEVTVPQSKELSTPGMYCCCEDQSATDNTQPWVLFLECVRCPCRIMKRIGSLKTALLQQNCLQVLSTFSSAIAFVRNGKGVVIREAQQMSSSLQLFKIAN